MSVSDNIELFIINSLKNSNELNIQRNELASSFGCSPSQINYVLQTRFSINRGYIISSRKGNGGYVKIMRIDLEDEEDIINLLENELGESVIEKEAEDILRRLEEFGHINSREEQIIQAAVSDRALMDIYQRDRTRATILKVILTQLLGREE